MNLKGTERIPFAATAAGDAYRDIRRLPVVVLLDNFRSLHNVGSFFRTADASGVELLLLCGTTGCPPSGAIAKTALGAEQTVRWRHLPEPLATLDALRYDGYELAAVETGPGSIDLYEWQPRFPVCIGFGNELDGLRPEWVERADIRVQIPMLGMKHSLNVATAGGVVLFELLRKYRELHIARPKQKNSML